MIFWTLFSKNFQFLDNFNKNPILLQLSTHINKSSQKFSLKLVFEQLLFIDVDHLSKIRFLLKLSKNGEFLLYKVLKIIKDQFFFVKSKLLRMYNFHIDFQFLAQKWLPRTSRCIWPTPGTGQGLAPTRLGQKVNQWNLGIFIGIVTCGWVLFWDIPTFVDFGPSLFHIAAQMVLKITK